VLLLSQEGRSLPAAARAFVAHVAQGLQARPAAPARIG
jgi:hypothetical protein